MARFTVMTGKSGRKVMTLDAIVAILLFTYLVAGTRAHVIGDQNRAGDDDGSAMGADYTDYEQVGGTFFWIISRKNCRFLEQ